MVGRGGVKWHGIRKGGLNQGRVTDHRLDSSVGKESACNAEDPGSILGSGRSAGERIGYPFQYSWASLVAQLIRIHMQCRRPGFNPWVGKIPWRKERLPTPVFWPGEFHGLYSLWGCKESDMAEWWLSLSEDKNAVYKFCTIRIFKLSEKLKE